MDQPQPHTGPLAFSADMVLAVLAKTKTETRRVVTPQPQHTQIHDYNGERLYDGEHRLWWWKQHWFENLIDFPQGEDRQRFNDLGPDRPGDTRWIQEAHRMWLAPEYGGQSVEVEYLADKAKRGVTLTDREWALMRTRKTEVKEWGRCPTIPPRFMYRSLSRAAIRILDVRAEWLQDIDDAGAVAEGMTGSPTQTPREQYADLWDRLHGVGAWAKNPLVWVRRFELVVP